MKWLYNVIYDVSYAISNRRNCWRVQEGGLILIWRNKIRIAFWNEHHYCVLLYEIFYSLISACGPITDQKIITKDEKVKKGRFLQKLALFIAMAPGAGLPSQCSGQAHLICSEALGDQPCRDRDRLFKASLSPLINASFLARVQRLTCNSLFFAKGRASNRSA